MLMLIVYVAVIIVSMWTIYRCLRTIETATSEIQKVFKKRR